MLFEFQQGQLGRSVTVSGLTGLEQYSTGIKGLHALKRKWDGYSGSCIRIRRSSDNAEQDIGFANSSVDAYVDTASAVSFSSGGNCFVTKIYDQSGNSNHLVQATNSKQPRCIASGFWDNFITFDGTSHGMQSTNNSGTVAIYHAAVLFNVRSFGGSQCVIERGNAIGVDGNNNNSAFIVGTTLLDMYSSQAANYIDNRFGVCPVAGSTLWYQWDYSDTGGVAARLKCFKDGVSQSSTPQGGSGTVSTSTVGSAVLWNVALRNNTSSPCGLDWYAQVFYEGSVSDADKATISAILKR